MCLLKQEIQRTWTKKNIGIILIVSFAYGIWFNYVDSVVYCHDSLINIIKMHECWKII
jgi:hypothetical protein